MVVTGEWKSFFCALSHTREQSQKKTSHIVYSKLIIIFFSCASQNICKEENSWKQQPQFGAKICVNICPWTLSFPRNPQFSLNFCFRETVRFLKQVMSPDKFLCIFLPSWRLLCLLPSNVFCNTWYKMFTNSFAVYCVGCSLLGVLWYECMKQKNIFLLPQIYQNALSS